MGLLPLPERATGNLAAGRILAALERKGYVHRGREYAGEQDSRFYPRADLMAVIVCRGCGASSSKGDEFVVKETILVTDYHRVIPVPTGIASVEITTAGEHPTPHGKPTLMCVSCEHEWTTTQDIDWMGYR